MGWCRGGERGVDILTPYAKLRQVVVVAVLFRVIIDILPHDGHSTDTAVYMSTMCSWGEGKQEEERWGGAKFP